MKSITWKHPEHFCYAIKYNLLLWKLNSHIKEKTKHSLYILQSHWIYAKSVLPVIAVLGSSRNYGCSLFAQYEADEYGCQQVLWLYGEDHQITEAGTMNVFLHWINEDGGQYHCRFLIRHDFIKVIFKPCVKHLRVSNLSHYLVVCILCSAFPVILNTLQLKHSYSHNADQER